MGGFGQVLVEKGAISAEQLEEALRFQQVYGGRMGTVVVDLGFLAVEELAEYLSDASGAPLPPPEWLEAPDPQALKQVPPPMIRRCQALPMRVENGELHVVMLDPTDPEKLDFLAMASSRRVVPYVLPERKLLYWLEVHCGIDRPPRFLGMVTRPRQIGLTKEEVESGTPMLDSRERIDQLAAETETCEPVDEGALLPEDGDGVATYQPLSLGTPIEDDATQTRAEPDDEILLLDELVAESPEAWELDEATPGAEQSEGATPEQAAHHDGATPASAAPTEPTSYRLARLENELYQSRNRDEVIGLALEIASHFCASAALFVVRGDTVSLFRASGRPKVDGDALSIPLQTPSLFTAPAQSGHAFRGQPPQGGVDGRVLDGLGRDTVQEILVHPVVIRGRVVNLLYADNGGEVFGETSVGALNALSHTLANAYERLIADQRRQRTS